MPELPDVEGFRRVLAEHARATPVEAVEARDAEMLRNATPQALGRALKGRRFADPSRHGKWLLAPAGDATVLMHFGMTGLLEWTAAGADRHAHDRIVFHCRGGELRYRDMRRLGGIWLARSPDELEGLVGSLGPDAQRIDRDGFHALLRRGRGAVKPALMKQEAIAGLGNLLTDELLWRARVHPRARTSTLSARSRDALFDAMRATLRASIPAGRVPARRGWLTAVRDERDGACPRCRARLRKGTVGGRTACWCPRCQRAPR